MSPGRRGQYAKPRPNRATPRANSRIDRSFAQRPGRGEEVLARERGDLERVGVGAGDPAQLGDLGADGGQLRTDVGDEHIGDHEVIRFVRRGGRVLTERLQILRIDSDAEFLFELAAQGLAHLSRRARACRPAA